MIRPLLLSDLVLSSSWEIDDWGYAHRLGEGHNKPRGMARRRLSLDASRQEIRRRIAEKAMR